jgi:DNA-binding IscR family transcriptional regulator
VLGGRLYEPEFCQQHHGSEQICNHSVDCTIRYLWRSLQQVVDQVLSKTTLEDLLPEPDPSPIPQAPTQITLARIN